VQLRRSGAAFLQALLGSIIAVILLVSGAFSAPYAAVVIDARTGEILHSRNSNTRLHPASLTKMMTLYIAFEAVQNGEISLDTKVRISRHAASEPPSKLGLRSGQTIAFRYLIRAAAVKSANDAATAIGEALSGSEAKFALRMTRTAKALGMSRTTFKNAHGLTEKGHMSTAHDMTILGRHLLYDYPQYYNLFSRRSTHAGIKTVPNTNRRLLGAYRGADGIKTGYTRAAGFNLVASAKRGNERIIATVFGGSSSVARNARVAELLDMGFKRAPTRAPLRKPSRPTYVGNSGTGAIIRLSGAVTTSLVPRLRPGSAQQPDNPATAPVLVAHASPDGSVVPTPESAAAQRTLVAMTEEGGQELVPLPPTAERQSQADRTGTTTAPTTATAIATAAQANGISDLMEHAIANKVMIADGTVIRPRLRPATDVNTVANTGTITGTNAGTNAGTNTNPLPQTPTMVTASANSEPPQTPNPQTNHAVASTNTGGLILTSAPSTTDAAADVTAMNTGAPQAAAPVVVTRDANKGTSDWSLRVGGYTTQFEAEKALLRVAMAETATLGVAVRKVVNTSNSYEARFLGLSQDAAQQACRRLAVRNYNCAVRGPT
jgi:D-alanyl-D-alanine carboxypeptidase